MYVSENQYSILEENTMKQIARPSTSSSDTVTHCWKSSLTPRGVRVLSVFLQWLSRGPPTARRPRTVKGQKVRRAAARFLEARKGPNKHQVAVPDCFSSNFGPAQKIRRFAEKNYAKHFAYHPIPI